MMTTRCSWWTLLAVLMGGFYLLMAGQNLLTTDPRRPGVALALAAFAALVPVTLTVRRRRPHLGNVLLGVAMLPAIAAWWTVVTPLAALAVVAGAIADRPQQHARAATS